MRITIVDLIGGYWSTSFATLFIIERGKTNSDFRMKNKRTYCLFSLEENCVTCSLGYTSIYIRQYERREIIIGPYEGHCHLLVEKNKWPLPGHSLSLFYSSFPRIFNEYETDWPFMTDVQRDNRRGIQIFFLFKPKSSNIEDLWKTFE